jgi:uncharacterized protein YqeY
MSSLKTSLQERLKEAMKAKDNFTRDCVRSITSAIKQVEVDTRNELSDDDIIKIIIKMVKQREDAVVQFRDGGRDDLVQKEQGEIDFLREYLPKQLSDSELEEKLKEIIKNVGATTLKDIGKVMGSATKSIGANADGKRVSEMTKKLLA